jgi:hypothetical protein
MVGGVEVAPTATCRANRWWRGTGRLPVGFDTLFTCLTVGFMSETHKGFGFFGAFAGWYQRLGCRWASYRRGCAFLVWLRLKELAAQTGRTVYQLKHGWMMTSFSNSRIHLSRWFWRKSYANVV